MRMEQREKDGVAALGFRDHWSESEVGRKLDCQAGGDFGS